MKKFKILIVDDNPHFISALKYMLTDYFQKRIELIDEAGDGQVCLDKLRTKIYDLVYMDINMPVMDGIKATREATQLYRNLIVIAVSFHSEMKYVVQMIEAGARSFIIKDDITRETLEKTLAIEYTY